MVQDSGSDDPLSFIDIKGKGSALMILNQMKRAFFKYKYL